MMNGTVYKIYTNGIILQLKYNYGNLSRIQNQKAEKFKLNRSKTNT